MIMINDHGQAMVNEGVIWYSAHISPIVPPPLSIYLTVFIAFNINNIIVIIPKQRMTKRLTPLHRNYCSHHHDHHHHQNIDLTTMGAESGIECSQGPQPLLW